MVTRIFAVNRILFLATQYHQKTLVSPGRLIRLGVFIQAGLQAGPQIVQDSVVSFFQISAFPNGYLLCAVYSIFVESWDIMKEINRTILQDRLRKGDEKSRWEAYTYRTPMPIMDVATYLSGDMYATCPRCKTPLERDYQLYCDHCGQALDWHLWEDEE